MVGIAWDTIQDYVRISEFLAIPVKPNHSGNNFIL
jgi:hypothetical protein